MKDYDKALRQVTIGEPQRVDEKRALAARTWEFVQQYADAKRELVEQILARAGAPPPNLTERERPG
jgi:GrpB-like predicted nucleotidyltransferase (UPF0157 family)